MEAKYELQEMMEGLKGDIMEVLKIFRNREDT